MSTNYDVAVIGAGVAGALIAWRLAEKGLKVVLIDAGEKRLEKNDRRQFVKVFAELPQARRTPSRPYTEVDADNKKFAHSPDAEDFAKPEPGRHSTSNNLGRTSSRASISG